MARSNLLDLMQEYPFWLFDAVPSAGALPVFNPLLGFSRITSPEWQNEIQEVIEGNWHYPRKIVKHGRFAPLTIARGVRFFDHDFYRWITVALEGNTGHFGPITGGVDIGGVTPRRNLVLIHFLSRKPIPAGIEAAARGIQLSAERAVSGANAQAATGVAGVIGTQTVEALQAAGNFLGGLAPPDVASRLPGRAFLLTGCVPSRYKAGGDFDASSSAISVAELDIEVEGVEQIALSA